MRAAARKRLVELVRGGLDVAAAAAELDLDLDAVHADRELMAELNRAYHVATAKLRSRLLSRVLESDGDDKLLASLLEKREAAEAAMAAANAVGNAGGTLERMRKELLAEVERYRAAMSPQCVCCGAPCAVCGGAEATVLAPRPKDEHRVEIDTTDLQGTQGAIAFDFTSSKAGDNTATILNFTHDGTTGLSETHGGLVQGDIILLFNPAPFTTIQDGSFFNELVVPFTSFGTSIGFTLQLTEVGPAEGELPDEFSFFMLGPDLQPLFMSADPFGAESLFAISVDGTPTGLLSPFKPTAFIPPDLLEIFRPPDAEPLSSGFFLSYMVIAPQSSPFPKVQLADRFESKRFKVVAPVRLLTPAETNVEEEIERDTHLLGYRIQRPRPVSSPRSESLTVVNALGELSFKLLRAPNTLLVPSAVDPSAAPSPPTPSAESLDHFKCYHVARVQGFEPREITVVDPFIPPPGRALRIIRPTQFCTAVDKNDEGIVDSNANLLCFTVLPQRGQPKHQPIFGILVNNQFGSDEVDTVVEREVCVPTQIIPETRVASVGVKIQSDFEQLNMSVEGQFCVLPDEAIPLFEE